MARKKKEEFVLSNSPEDLGFREYAFGQSVKKQKLKGTAKSGERKKVWRSPASVYMILLGVFLTFWFLYSMIAALVNGGGKVEILIEFLTSFMALAVCLAIVICTVFGLWGKFARFALSHGMVRRRDVANVEESAQMTEEAYEKAQAPSPFFEVYTNYIRATDNGAVKVINRAGIAKIKAYLSFGTCSLIIISDGEICKTDCIGLRGLNIPLREMKKLKKLLGDKLEIEPLSDKKGEKTKRKKRSFSINVALLAVGLLCAAVGGGVIALHLYLAESIPIAVGAFFIAGGVLLTFVAFERVPIIKVFFIPLMFGGIFTVIPVAFLNIMSGGAITFTSVHHFFCSFSALLCGVAFLESMGGLILFAAFYGLYKYIRYGEH